jgi:hypothetical protein
MKKPTLDPSKIHIIVDDITVSEIMSYDQNYMEKIKSLFEDAASTSRRTWLTDNRIKVTRMNIPQKETMTVRSIFYAALTEKQATEYHLRF